MKIMMLKNSLAKNLGLGLSLIIGTASAFGSDLVPEINCSGSVKVLKTSAAFGMPDSKGNYDILFPGVVGFNAEVAFGPGSPDCEDAVKQLGIKPYVSSTLRFQGAFSKGSPELAAEIASDIVGETLSYQLVIKGNSSGPQFPAKILAAQVGPEIKFVGSSSSGLIAVSSFAAQDLVFSTAHAPKTFSDLSDADKLADATLIFHEPEFLETIPFKASSLGTFLKKTLMPKAVAAKKAYLEMVTSTLLTQIAPDKQPQVLSLAGNSSVTIGELISKLGTDPGVLDAEAKAQLLLTFPGLLQTLESCLSEDAAVKLGFLKKAQEFKSEWMQHTSSLKDALEGIVAEQSSCDMARPTDEMKDLAAAALAKI